MSTAFLNARRAAIGVAMAGALGAAVTPQAFAATGPAQQSSIGALTYSIANGANVDPPGANDWNCRPSARYPRPVMLVHGTWGNKYANFAALSPRLKQYGMCVFALNYSTPAPILPVLYGTGPIRAAAAQLSGQIDQVLAATGASKVDIVGYSQGGMMPRAAIKYYGAGPKIESLVSISATNGGTSLNGIGTLGRQLGVLTQVGIVAGQAAADQVVGSSFMTQLNAGGQTVPGVKYTAIATKYDEVTTPYQNSYILSNPAGASVTNIGLQNGCGTNFADHLSAPFSVRTAHYVAKALGAPVSSRAPCDVQLPVF